MWTLRIKRHFDSAHQLEHYKAKCANLHGHRWDVEFYIEANEVNHKSNMVCDFKIIKDILESILPDHKCLNEVFKQTDPTAEYLARALFCVARQELEDVDLKLTKVILWENPDCGVEYYE